jgi:hypothetical protein
MSLSTRDEIRTNYDLLIYRANPRAVTQRASTVSMAAGGRYTAYPALEGEQNVDGRPSAESFQGLGKWQRRALL